jgi:hypothetical protein
MGFWSKDKSKKLDEEMEKKLTILFKKLDQESDPERKKGIMQEIRREQESYKETRKKKYKWWFIK